MYVDDITRSLGLPPDWAVDALCAQTDPELFFADKGGGAAAATAQARSICGRCLVRATCLEWALAFEGDMGAGRRTGVWGGLTPEERAALAKSRNRQRVHA